MAYGTSKPAVCFPDKLGGVNVQSFPSVTQTLEPILVAVTVRAIRCRHHLNRTRVRKKEPDRQNRNNKNGNSDTRADKEETFFHFTLKT